MRTAAKCLLWIAVLSVLLSGCVASQQEITRAGLTLTLPESFTDQTDSELNNGFDVFCINRYVAVCGTKESKQELTAYLDSVETDDYAQAVIDKNKLSCTLQETDGLYHFTYTQTVADRSYTYLCVIREAGDTLWLLQSYCTSEKYPELEQDMWNYLTGARITE